MESKELIRQIKYNEMLSPETCREIIQRLMEYDELKKLLYDVVDPMNELFAYLFQITSDFK